MRQLIISSAATILVASHWLACSDTESSSPSDLTAADTMGVADPHASAPDLRAESLSDAEDAIAEQTELSLTSDSDDTAHADDTGPASPAPPSCNSAQGTLPEGLVTLAWDSGEILSSIPEGSWQLTVDDIPVVIAEQRYYEAVRFEIAHPARVHGFQIMWVGVEEAQLPPEAALGAGLYDDFGHNGFDFWAPDPLWEGARCVQDHRPGEWLDYVFDDPVTVAHPGLVYVAHLASPESANIAFSQGPLESCPVPLDDCHSALNLPELGSYYNGRSSSFAHDFMIRLWVEYTEQISDDEAFFQPQDLPLSRQVAWGDYDNDGWDDLLLAGPRLFRNQQDGSFVERTEDAGLDAFNAAGGVWGDYDNDGCLDMALFANGTEHPPHLLRNGCDGSFVDVSESSGLRASEHIESCAEAHARSTTTAWLDIDADGWLDLYIGNARCWSGDYFQDVVLRNRGDGSFEDWTASMGFSALGTPSRSSNPIDHDRDGDVDLLVTNYLLDANLFFDNQGDGTVLERAEALGLAGARSSNGYYGHTIGGAWGDLDNDGDFDCVQGNLAHPRYFGFSDKTQVLLNDGSGHYLDIQGGWSTPWSETGLRYQETHSVPVLADFDHDGALDLMLTACRESRPADFYWGHGDGRFTLDAYRARLDTTELGWGAAAADFDHDGDPDLFANQLFRNALRPEDKGHWLQVRVVGNVSANRFGFGATVEVLSASRTQIRHVQGSSGKGCQDSQTLHFGLGDDAEVSTIRVTFPGGLHIDYEGPIASDQRLWLFEDGRVGTGWQPPE